MTEIDSWPVEVSLREAGRETRAEARLIRETVGLVGHGLARRNRDDPQVTQIGEEIAAARALSDLAHQLLSDAAQQIEGITHQRANLTLLALAGRLPVGGDESARAQAARQQVSNGMVTDLHPVAPGRPDEAPLYLQARRASAERQPRVYGLRTSQPPALVDAIEQQSAQRLSSALVAQVGPRQLS